MTTKPLLPELKPSGNTHGNPLERRRGFLAGMGGDGLPVIGWTGESESSGTVEPVFGCHREPDNG